MCTHACLVALLVVGTLQPQSAEPGWTSLFNGTDFTGWKISEPESFTIADGALRANRAASHAYYDGPFRNHHFRNFELKVDVMTEDQATRLSRRTA